MEDGIDLDGPREDEELLELFARIPDDPSAREQIALRHQSLATYLARRFSGRGEAVDDLVQVANIGLMHAIDRFDAGRGVQFPTYATATMVGELKRHFRDKGWAVRMPRPLQEAALRLNQVLPTLSQELGRSPTIGEIADRLEISRELVVEAMDAAQAYSTSSLDEPAATTGTTPAEMLGDDDPSIGLLEGWASVAPAIKLLPERERHVLYLRFFRDMTQSEIAAEIGVSQMHVSRILTQTLEHLRAETAALQD
jgi:RNA polymerase sigma-B factor